MSKIVIVSNTSWYLYNFRLSLISFLIKRGYHVIILSPTDKFSKKLTDLGCKHFHILIDNKGLNPLKDILFLKQLYTYYKSINPNLIISYTIKPVIYSSIVASKLGILFVNNITGLGTSFIKINWVTWLVKLLYRITQKNAAYVFFQNSDDKNLFLNSKLLTNSVAHDVIPGTGIDTHRFSVHPYPPSGSVTFLLIGRMLWDKGVREFIHAASQIFSEFNHVRFQLLGFLDVNNRTAISAEQIQIWAKQGFVEYLGDTADVRPYISSSSCVVLPSYREGLPRTLLEAASMARPIIATDVTGCRDIVVNGVNGFLCKPRDADDLANKIRDMVMLPNHDRREMGLKGRKMIIEQFDEKIIIEKIFNRIQTVLNPTY